MKFRRDSGSESSRFSSVMKALSRHKLAIACTLIAICFVIGAEPRKAAALVRKHQSFFPNVTVGKLYDMFAAGTGMVRVQDPPQPLHKPRWRQSDDQPTSSNGTAQGPPVQLIPNATALGSDSCPGTSITSLPFSDSDTTIGANNTVTAIPGGCSTYTTVAGPDKIYTFTVVTAGSLTVLATPSGGTYDLATYLISSCPGGTGNAIGSGCVGGIDAHADNSAETFTVGSIPVGTYYLYVDSFYTTAGKSSGPYTLSITGSAILGAGCTVTCPTNVTTANDPNQCGAVVTYPAPTTSGSCGTVTCSPASGSFFPVGTTTVNCAGGGGAGFGLKAAPEAAPGCSFTVTINDTQPPQTPICPANINRANDANQCGAVVTYTPPSAGDNCPGTTVACSPPSGSFFPVGTSSVTCTASDASPNSPNSTCGFTVTVNDTQPPAITCPANITAPNDQNQCGAVVTYTTPIGSDNCNSAPGLHGSLVNSPEEGGSSVTVNCSPASGSFFPVGTTTITCTASDASPNSPDATCTFTVMVQDTQPPVITCPANVTVPNDPNQCGAVATFPNPVITDNCPGTFAATCTPPSGSFFAVGTTAVTCTVGGSGGGCPTITESSSQTITASNSVSCNNGVGHTDNSYWRAFTLPTFSINNAFNVQSVDIGIETASSGNNNRQSSASRVAKNGQKQGFASPAAPAGSGQPITVRIYTSSQAFPAGFPGSLTLIGTTSTTVNDQAGTIINVPITGTAPGGSQLVVEVLTPNGQAAGNLFFFGSNSSSQTAPSYLSAADCGITTPTTTTAIGFPDMHIVMNVHGCEASSGPMPSCTFSVTVTNAAPVLTYASPQTVFLGQGITVNPATGPSDTNLSTITVQSVAAGFSGTVTVNNTTGVVTITNATPVGSFPITIRATDTCGRTTDATFTLNVVCPAINVNPASLPGGTIGTAYSQTVSAVPAGVYSFTVTNGALPVGLALNASTGVISGTPSQGGTYSFRITATSGLQCSGFRDYTVTIACPAITLTTPLPPATAGIAYSASVAASPAGSYIYTVVLGTLPYGLTLNSSTGSLSGLPTVAGTFNFSIKADRGNGCVGTQGYTMVVGCPTITVLPNTLPNGTVGTGYSQTLSATPATGSYSFAISSGNLPPGLSLLTTGLLSGTPTTNGTYNFSVTATAFGTCTSAPKSYSITVGSSGCPTITLPSSLPNGTVGQPYSNSVAASPSGSYTYTVTSGSLPPGVTLYSSIGLLYGYPTTGGTYPFTITATNSSNCMGSQAYTVVISGGGQFRAFNDFSGDHQSDFVLWRPAQMRWLIVNSSTGSAQTTQWGNAGDQAVAGDYDGDGKADWATFGTDGHWRIKLSGDGTMLDTPWGMASDVPVPGDYDGDGKTDIAVWRGAESVWYILRSSDGQTQTISWGASYAPYYDVPVPADYDGDGKTDAAVFRKSTGHWYIKRSSDGQTVDKYWGLGTDVPVPADYDGDGKADIAVWRGDQSLWYIIRSSDGAVDTKLWGASYSPYFDMPAVGDYDGDGKADIAIWRKSEGRWYVLQSSDGATRMVTQGQASDRPVTGTP